MKPTSTGQDAGNAVGRPLRSDALRNRARIVEAAEVVFAADGMDVQVDDIARKAGVGVGTVYRHFPTKDKLWEAILLDRLASLAHDAQRLATAYDPGGAFFDFVTHVVEEGCSKRHLVFAVMGVGREFDKTAAAEKEALRAAVEVLLSRAQKAGAVRVDVTAETVVALMGATSQAAVSAGATAVDELLGIVCDGMRPPAAC